MLLVASLVTAVWILRKIRKNRVKQEDALFWLCFAFMLALFGIFPKLSYMMAEILGIQSPANFVFLAVIAILIEKMFSLSIQVSSLENKLEIMAAELALQCKNMEDEIKKNKDRDKEQ
jgi:hypothetical protein